MGRKSNAARARLANLTSSIKPSVNPKPTVEDYFNSDDDTEWVPMLELDEVSDSEAEDDNEDTNMDLDNSPMCRSLGQLKVLITATELCLQTLFVTSKHAFKHGKLPYNHCILVLCTILVSTHVKMQALASGLHFSIFQPQDFAKIRVRVRDYIRCWIMSVSTLCIILQTMIT